MNNVIKLATAVKYSKKRINVGLVNLDNYISIDNILQNKAGISKAVKLPPSSSDMSAYESGHILVGNIRPYLKKIWFSNRIGGCSPDVLNFEVKDGFDQKFIYYTMFRDDFFAHMMRGSKGSKMPRGDKNQIVEFLIPDFKLPTQKKIATILSVIDTKIENNQRINAQLELIGKTLYDYWFVQFDFPDKSGKPYKSNGGKMVFDNQLKREIPIGWKSGKLTSIANITMGQSPPGDSYNENGIGEVFFQGCTDFSDRFPVVRLYTSKPTRFAKSGDILLSVRAPVGTLNIADKNCCIGRGLAAINSKGDSISYLYEVVKGLKQIFDRRNVGGTTFGSITKDDLYSLPVLIPEEELIRKYHQLINPTFKQQNILAEEIRSLCNIRDWLLPILMNGQVKVN